MIPRDTRPEAYEIQLGLYRALPAGRKAEMAAMMSDEVRQISRDGIRRRHPEYSDLEVTQALAVLLFGRETAERLWPSLEGLTH